MDQVVLVWKQIFFQVFGVVDKCGSTRECAGHIQYLTMNEFVQASQISCLRQNHLLECSNNCKCFSKAYH
jgi:hypothetical protein